MYLDTHVDLPILIRAAYGNKIYGENFTFREGLMGHVDLPRLKKGRVGGMFWSVFMPCPKNSSDFSDSTYHEVSPSVFISRTKANDFSLVDSRHSAADRSSALSSC